MSLAVCSMFDCCSMLLCLPVSNLTQPAQISQSGRTLQSSIHRLCLAGMSAVKLDRVHMVMCAEQVVLVSSSNVLRHRAFSRSNASTEHRTGLFEQDCSIANKQAPSTYYKHCFSKCLPRCKCYRWSSSHEFLCCLELFHALFIVDSLVHGSRVHGSGENCLLGIGPVKKRRNGRACSATLLLSAAWLLLRQPVAKAHASTWLSCLKGGRRPCSEATT